VQTCALTIYNDVFKLYAQIIELNEKPYVPSGEMGYNLSGEKIEFDTTQRGEVGLRAIVDIGLLDVEDNHITLVEKEQEIIGASSDMMVIDLKDNKKDLQVGDFIEIGRAHV